METPELAKETIEKKPEELAMAESDDEDYVEPDTQELDEAEQSSSGRGSTFTV